MLLGKVPCYLIKSFMSQCGELNPRFHSFFRTASIGTLPVTSACMQFAQKTKAFCHGYHGLDPPNSCGDCPDACKCGGPNCLITEYL
jgi:hypothetical protein